MSKAEVLTPMQQQILDRADAIFASIGTAVNKATDFAGEQIPDIALQYILYSRVYLTSIVVAAVLVFVAQQIIALKWIGRCVERNKDRYYDTDILWLNYFLSTIFTGIITGFTFAANFSSMLKVWFAPKIFLIEQVAHLAKSLH